MGTLTSLLAAEQRAFLHRDRRGWEEHLTRARAFLGEGLAGTPPDQPCLVLGAGSGLEIPWRQASRSTWGWDADPWSRLRTLLRHRRWAPWVFADLTGGLGELEEAIRRCLREPWPKGRTRPRARVLEPLAGLMPALRPDGARLGEWLAGHQPARILSANVMGQFGVVAQRLLEGFLGPWPWTGDPEAPDPVGEALEAWITRALEAHLAWLAASGADVWLLYDRGVLHGGQDLALGDWRDPWQEQILGAGQAELEDPLCGVDPAARILTVGPARRVLRRDRWLWPVAAGQTHVMEALVVDRPRP